MSVAIEQIRQMGSSFLQRLPHVAVALLVFLGFFLAAKVLRRTTRRIFEKRTRHRNLGFMVGRLAQGTLIVLGLLVALVIALPTFRPGQLVQLLGISSVAIEDIQTRATTIRTYDGRRIVIPNGELFTHSVIVNTAFPHRRLEYDVGIGYGDDVERAKELMLEAMRNIEEVLDDPAPGVLLVGLGPSSVKLRARWCGEVPRPSGSEGA